MATLKTPEDSILAVRNWIQWHPREMELIGDDLKAVLRLVDAMMNDKDEAAEAQTRVIRLLSRAVDEVTSERDALIAARDAALAGREGAR